MEGTKILWQICVKLVLSSAKLVLDRFQDNVILVKMVFFYKILIVQKHALINTILLKLKKNVFLAIPLAIIVLTLQQILVLSVKVLDFLRIQQKNVFLNVVIISMKVTLIIFVNPVTQSVYNVMALLKINVM
jgi:hypothetical protein